MHSRSSAGAVSGDPAERLADIRKQHCDLAKDLGLDGPEILGERLHELEQLIAGVRLVKEVSVRVRVRVMALGELMSTLLGAAFLQVRVCRLAGLMRATC